tara:strand:- start:622 stop:903 length:282 start_codon:yes stop_codon:yes gene_type:complete
MNVIETGELLVTDWRHPASWFDDKKDAVLADGQCPAPRQVSGNYLPLIRNQDVRQARFSRIPFSVAVAVFINESTRAWGLLRRDREGKKDEDK